MCLGFCENSQDGACCGETSHLEMLPAFKSCNTADFEAGFGGNLTL